MQHWFAVGRPGTLNKDRKSFNILGDMLLKDVREPSLNWVRDDAFIRFLISKDDFLDSTIAYFSHNLLFYCFSEV